MEYISTRDVNCKVSASYAIVTGISKDGGLFVPSFLPYLSDNDFNFLANATYKERAAYILSKFLADFSYEEILDYTTKAYAKFCLDAYDCHLDSVPLVLGMSAKNEGILELWHGPTAAFKDVALTLLPYLMTASKEKVGEKSKTLVLVATSGDTGKAALEGFKDVEGTQVIVFYPSQGVSKMQKLQMMTQDGDNVYVAAISGNFDDAQTAVKQMFQNAALRESLSKLNVKLSSANSINLGRLLPQIVYYISAYIDYVKNNKNGFKFGDALNVCVPTGNFGNILAAYYAKCMGININKLICASNSNNILTDFFRTGVYDIKREFYKTISPSMDILISSNLERLLFEFADRDDKYICEIMKQLKTDGRYEIKKEYLDKINKFFDADCANERETKDAIKEYNDKYGYLLDPHTAVAVAAYKKYKKRSNDDLPYIIASTANPYKFPCDVLDALGGDGSIEANLAVDKLVEDTAVQVPMSLSGLYSKKIRFEKIYDREEIKKAIEDFAKGEI